MNNLKWMGHSATIMDIQRSLRDDSDTCEVILAAKDGISVRAHLFVLSTCSDLMRNLLVDVPPGQEATIILPDIRGELLETMLSFIYMGETSLPSASLTEFLEAINLLGIKSAISFECNPTSQLNTSNVEQVVAVEAAKSISGLQIASTELMEDEEEAAVQTQATENAVTANPQPQQPTPPGRDLEFLDMYNEQPKITYSIEHMGGNTSGNQYILTENTGTFTITQSAATPMSKLDSSHVDMAEDDDAEADVTDEVDEQESQLIEEEYVAADPLVDMQTDAEMGEGENDEDDEAEEDMEMDIKANLVHATKVKARRPAPAKVLKRQSAKQLQFVALKSGPKDGINDALELAAEAVLNEGLSLQKAADRFDVSKTVLWRRVRSNPEYLRSNREKPSLSEAYERLKSGDSLKSISQDLNIPMSTLHRHKVRLAAQGRLPDFVACRRRDSTPKDELRDKLAKAVHACINEGMSQNHAANLFEIPKSTLWRHLQRRVAATERKVKLEQHDVEEEDLLN